MNVEWHLLIGEEPSSHSVEVLVPRFSCPGRLDPFISVATTAVLLFGGVEGQAQTALATTVEDTSPTGARHWNTSPPSSVEDVVDATDLLVLGVALPPRTALSDDGSDLYFDYALDDPLILFPQEQTVRRHSAGASEIIVRQLVGTVTARAPWRSEPAPTQMLDPGAAYVLFLMTRGDHYAVAAAFRIAKERLIPRIPGRRFDRQYLGAPAKDFATDMARRLSARRDRAR